MKAIKLYQPKKKGILTPTACLASSHASCAPRRKCRGQVRLQRTFLLFFCQDVGLSLALLKPRPDQHNLYSDVPRQSELKQMVPSERILMTNAGCSLQKTVATASNLNSAMSIVHPPTSTSIVEPSGSSDFLLPITLLAPSRSRIANQSTLQDCTRKPAHSMLVMSGKIALLVL